MILVAQSLLHVVLAAMLPVVGGNPDHLTVALASICISGDGQGFELAESGRPFRVWGVNYDHDASAESRLIEDYWESEWETIRQDFAEIRELGANVVRIHLQFGRFMDTADTASAAALSRLLRLVELAEETGLYLDLTGLGCYHRKDVPAWYDALDEPARWAAQAEFWRAVARTCRGRAAVFCYNLMNEPIIGGDVSEGWLAGELGGKHFAQRLTLKAGDRPAVEIARAWVEKLTAVIREEDPGRLITVGVIPWAMVWPNVKPVFYAPEVARHLDFVSVHCYPISGEVDQALSALKAYDIGKPLVIEEMFPLRCSLEELDAFIRGSEDVAEGWIGFYWGRSQAEYEAAGSRSVMAGWLEYFRSRSLETRNP